MAEIKGDLRVRRTMSADRRANEGLNQETLAADRVVVLHDYSWLSLDGAAADRAITLPDATTLTQGWKIVIHNVGTTNNLNVTDSAAGALKTVPFVPAPANSTAAYQFVLIDNSSAAGVWYVVEVGDPTIAGILASKFAVSFLVADWPVAAGGYQVLTSTQVAGLAAATHGRGINPVYVLQEKVGSNFLRTQADAETFDASGNLSLQIVDGVAFDGRVVLV